MNHKRHEQLLAAQSVIARKVFAAVPAQEAWSSKKIYQELMRIGSSTRDVRVVEGCLNTLVEVGLVQEIVHGSFIRIQPKAETVPLNVAIKALVAVEENTVASADVFCIDQARQRKVEVIDAYANDPYRTVEKRVYRELDSGYISYLSLRTERAMQMLTLLSESVEAELGLALLEIVEDLRETDERTLNYVYTLGHQVDKEIMLNPGWYMHEIDGRTHFSREATLTPELTETLRQEAAVLMNTLVEKMAHVREFQAAEQEKWKDDIFAKYETSENTDHPYYDSLLDKLKTHVPGIEPVAPPEERMVKETHADTVKHRANRKRVCDLRVLGLSEAPEYRAWCNVSGPSRRKIMAEQGLTVEQRWIDSFKAFLADIGYRPTHDAFLQRIDRNIGWVKGNTEWRVGSTPVPARKRAPPGWPLMVARDKALKSLSQAYKEGLKKIQGAS